MEFKGNLIRGPQACEECSAFHEVRRQRYVDGVKRDVIFYECNPALNMKINIRR